MNIIYLIGVIVLMRFFISTHKRNNIDKKQILNDSIVEVDLIEMESLIETPKALVKNKWLYLDDEFVEDRKPKHFKPKDMEYN